MASRSVWSGDKVIISETRPLSARKRYILDKIVERAGVKHEEPELVIEETKEPDVVLEVKKAKAKAPKKEVSAWSSKNQD